MTACTYCEREMDPPGSKTLLERTADHVVPQCRGGIDTVPACWQCNNIKGNMSPAGWAAFMAANPRWWERCDLTRGRVRIGAPMTAPETREFLRQKGIEAALAKARPCTDDFLPAGHELKDPNTGTVLAVLGEDRRFKLPFEQALSKGGKK